MNGLNSVKHRFLPAAGMLLLTLFLCTTGVAAATGESYTYNVRNEVQRVPDPYQAVQTVGADLLMNAPQDMVVNNEWIYILDSGNHRIVVLDRQYAFKREIRFQKDGKEYPTDDLSGIWVDNDQTILVVDHGSKMILRLSMQGEVLREYPRPEGDIQAAGKDYQPNKVLTDGSGTIFVLCDNEYRGLMMMTPEGVFDSYFGPLRIGVSANLLKDMFWRNFMTDEQIESSWQYVPGEYMNMTIDSKGFLYAVRGQTTNMGELVRKLNPAGDNVLDYTGDFGDANMGAATPTSFNAVTVDDKGFISALDSAHNRIFQYSPEGELLYIFGGEGVQNGTFTHPVDIDVNGEDLLVLDRDTACMTVLRCREFGAKVRQATNLYRQAAFKEAGLLWRQVLQQNGRYQPAYVGCGKVYEAAGEYQKAMEYYHLGGSRRNYSMAFKKYRTAVLREHFAWIAAGVLVLVAALMVLGYLRRKGKILAGVSLEHGGKLRYVGYILRHPIEGYSELRYNGKYSLRYANIIVLLWFFVSCLNYNYNGFLFNPNTPSRFNIFVVLASTVGVLALFALVNWLLSTFFEGKGRFKEVWIGLSYAMLPLLFTGILELILSNCMTLEENFFIGALQVIGFSWMLIMGFFALSGIHQYRFKWNILSILATVVGMLAVVFLLFLLFNLWTQVASFFEVVLQEIVYRHIAGI